VVHNDGVGFAQLGERPLLLGRRDGYRYLGILLVNKSPLGEAYTGGPASEAPNFAGEDTAAGCSLWRDDRFEQRFPWGF